MTLALEDVDSWVALIAGPILGLLAGLVAMRFFLRLADCISSGRQFRARGFRVHDELLVNGQRAVLVCQGVWSTSFLISNCPKHELLVIPNDRLRFAEIRIMLNGNIQEPH